MNKSYRSIWNETLNSWVAVAENVPARGKSSGSSKVMLASMLALAPLSAVYATDECGPASSGQSVVCTGNDSGHIYYDDKNINLTLDGNTADGSVNISGVQLIGNDSAPNGSDWFDLSLKTEGMVNISGDDANLIYMYKPQGAGDLTLSLGDGTTLHQTGMGWDSAIYTENHNYLDNANTVIDIAKGTSIKVEKEGYDAVAIRSYHYSQGDFRLSNNGLINVSANTNSPNNYGYAKGIYASVSANNSLIENNGQIFLDTGATDGKYGAAIDAHFDAYDYNNPLQANVIHTGTIQGDAKNNPGQWDDLLGINVQFNAYGVDDAKLNIISSGDIKGVNKGIQAYIEGENASGLIYQNGGTIEAEQVGIQVGGYEAAAEVRTSGAIVTGKNKDTKGVYITSSSGGLLALGIGRKVLP